MGFIRAALISIILVLATLISIIGIMIEIPPLFGYEPTRVNELGRSFLAVMRPGNGMLWFWLALLLLVLLTTWITLISSRKKMRVEVQMGGGKVVIMDSAIRKYIRNALTELSEVTVRKIKLRDSRNGLHVNIIADVRTHENLPVLERRIISRVRSALAEDLGITKLSEVHVLVRDFDVSGRAVHASDDVPARTKADKKTDTDTTLEEKQPDKTAEPPVSKLAVLDETPVAAPLSSTLTEPPTVMATDDVAPDSVSYDRSEFQSSLPANELGELPESSPDTPSNEEGVVLPSGSPEDSNPATDSGEQTDFGSEEDDDKNPPPGSAPDKIVL